MTAVRDIQMNGLLNKEPPEITLKKLFDYTDAWNQKGIAFINVSYRSELMSGDIGSCRHVVENKLANYTHTVRRDHHGSICVYLTDHVDTTWPKKAQPPDLY